MTYNIYFDIGALCVGIIMLITFYYRKTVASVKTTVFEWLLWANAGAALMDILAVFGSYAP